MTTSMYIKPKDVGGHPEHFMCWWECPICGCCNNETFLIDGADYRCDGCNSILEYRVPKKKTVRKTLYYSYIIGRKF